MRISQSSIAKPGWLSSPAELNRRIREAIPGGGSKTRYGKSEKDGRGRRVIYFFFFILNQV